MLSSIFRPPLPMYSSLNLPSHWRAYSILKTKLNLWAVAFCYLTTTAVAQKTTIDFKAAGIVVVSDADMVASALVDGKLLKMIGGRDLLTTIPMPLVNREQEFGEVIVPNSATGSPKSLAISNDGKVGFVIETRGGVADSTKQVKDVHKDLLIGRKMYVVDMNNTAKPRVRFAVPIGKYPTAIDAIDGQLMIACDDPGKELFLIEVDAVGRPMRTIVSSIGIPDVHPTDISWHPTTDMIVVTLDHKSIVMMKPKRKTQTDEIIGFELIGKPLVVGSKLSVGYFTPNGKYYVVADSKDGIAKSELFTISLDDKNGNHTIVSQLQVGVGAKSFAISPTSNLIVTTNSNQTHLPYNQANISLKSSLSIALIAPDGKLTAGDEVSFDGIMPRAIAFDKTGENLAVGVYEYFDYGRRSGGIEFWKVSKDPKPILTKSQMRISVARGCHAIKVIH
jgi:DNA-binding beta-propeller fold protein YncE